MFLFVKEKDFNIDNVLDKFNNQLIYFNECSRIIIYDKVDILKNKKPLINSNTIIFNGNAEFNQVLRSLSLLGGECLIILDPISLQSKEFEWYLRLFIFGYENVVILLKDGISENELIKEIKKQLVNENAINLFFEQAYCFYSTNKVV